MKLLKYISTLSSILTLMIFASCKDELDFSELGDGESLVEATLEFKQTAVNLGSRTSGTAIQNINDLYIVIYNANEEKTFNRLLHFVKDPKPNSTDLSFKELTTTTDTPSDYPGDKSDVETAKANCSFKLPYGRYYMYAVANLHEGDDKSQYKTLTEDDVNNIENLKNITCDWYSTDVTKNDEMFGYFTNDFNDNGDRLDTAFDESDPTVVVNKKAVQLHSWIKRLASKVTIAFDGSGLKNNIYVYIHNVSIRQIPLSCKLGENNTPDAENPVTPAYFNESVPENDAASQVLFYNSNGYTEEYSAYNPVDRDEAEKWLMIGNGTGVLGSKDHNTDDPALFFYENMQGDFKKKYDDKEITKEQLDTYDKEMAYRPNNDYQNVGPADALPDGYTSTDYRDNVPYGTFIEVEGYYYCGEAPVNYGPIRYRFMLGQDTKYNYNAIRNHHYKVTLCFNGYANQPDWHIEYNTEPPAVFTPDVYIPYTYNTSVNYPITFKGNLIGLQAEIIENNWAPYDETEELEVPALDTYGETSLENRTLQFVWYRNVFLNQRGNSNNAYNTVVAYADPNKTNQAIASSNNSTNYVYGRHRSDVYYHLDEEGNDIRTEPYIVTPIWAGFLRLMQPAEYNDDTKSLPTVLLPNSDETGANNYSSDGVLKDFRDYYLGNMTNDSRGSEANTTPLWKRTFTANDLTERKFGNGRNDYEVEKTVDSDGNTLTTVTLKLWTQPKSMCGISGFSGNNPYEDYNRKAVIRFTATFDRGGETKTIRTDVPVIQAKRLVNPKAVWRRHDNPEDFHVTMMERNLDDNSRTTFRAVESRGDWRARIVAGNGINGYGKKFINLIAENGSIQDGDEVTGKSPSNITFKIDFLGELSYTESECAQIQITYHGNSCVHNIFVRQGYHEPLQLSDQNDTPSPYWSSYNVYSFDRDTPYEDQTGTHVTTLTKSPLSLGAFFKKGNYAQGISVSNIADTGMGILEAPGSGLFTLTGDNPLPPAQWSAIQGVTTTGWHWAESSVTLNYTDDNDEEKTVTRKYRVPTLDDFQTLLENNNDFGVGVLYGDFATEPALTTSQAFGFLDSQNQTTQSKSGMRGFICYNSISAKQIFFPIGTSGIGRRTTQGISNTNQRGTLRYSSVNFNLNSSATSANTMRPIAVNMLNAPGSIYWIHQADDNHGAWEMNYFDLNFNSVNHNFVSGTGDTPARGPNGDALPLRLVLDGKPSDYPEN